MIGFGALCPLWAMVMPPPPKGAPPSTHRSCSSPRDSSQRPAGRPRYRPRCRRTPTALQTWADLWRAESVLASAVCFPGRGHVRGLLHRDKRGSMMALRGSPTSQSLPTTPLPARHFLILCHEVGEDAACGLYNFNNLQPGRVDLWCRCISAGLYLSDALRRDTHVSLALLAPHPAPRGAAEGSGSPGACRLVTVDGSSVRTIAPDEKAVAMALQQALQEASMGRILLCRSAGKTEEVEEEEQQPEQTAKSSRNRRMRREGWIARLPGSRGPVPGIRVQDFGSLSTCLEAMGAAAPRETLTLLLHQDGGELPELLDKHRPCEGARASRARGSDAASGEEATAPRGHTSRVLLVMGDNKGMTEGEGRAVMEGLGASSARLGPRTLLASHCIVLAHNHLDLLEDDAADNPHHHPS